ncbi:MAG: CoA transferase subunit A [Acidaminococcaceae bacterium]|nr:CoA transferase subunit A [Acidaminococcaceae bacterium]
MAKIMSAEDAVKLITSNSSIMVGGFGNIGNPKKLIDLIAETDLKELTIMGNDLGTPNVGLGRLVRNRQIKQAIGSYFTYNTEAAELYFEGKLNLKMMPQGTFAESIRAGGCGLGGFYTRVGIGSEVTEGLDTKEINGKTYVLVEPLTADFAILRAKKADRLGNLVYERTARNFNPVMATAAKFTIVEVDEIVEPGELDPEEIVTPFVYVDVVVPVGRGE